MVTKISFAVLTQEEKAYILDTLTRSSYYEDWFGELDAKREEKLIISIFSKLQGF
jgi:hypothetical protein